MYRYTIIKKAARLIVAFNYIFSLDRIRFIARIGLDSLEIAGLPKGMSNI